MTGMKRYKDGRNRTNALEQLNAYIYSDIFLEHNITHMAYGMCVLDNTDGIIRLIHSSHKKQLHTFHIPVDTNTHPAAHIHAYCKERQIEMKVNSGYFCWASEWKDTPKYTRHSQIMLIHCMPERLQNVTNEMHPHAITKEKLIHP